MKMKNIPNILSGIRIILVPFFVFFYMADFIPSGKLIALIIFIVASLTDMLDGKIARKYNLVSDLGKLLDPIADKVLVLSALLLVSFDYTIPAPFGLIALLIIIARDYVVDAIRQISASKGVVIAADIWGKMKTMVTMITLVLLILYAYFSIAFNFDDKFMYIFHAVTLVMFAISVLLTILSGTNYLIKNRGLFVSKQVDVQNNGETVEKKQELDENKKNENEELNSTSNK